MVSWKKQIELYCSQQYWNIVIKIFSQFNKLKENGNLYRGKHMILKKHLWKHPFSSNLENIPLIHI